jgi:hypothetical protein
MSTPSLHLNTHPAPLATLEVAIPREEEEEEEEEVVVVVEERRV